MPLDAEREGAGIGDPDGLDRAVIGQGFDDQVRRQVADRLAVQRIDGDTLSLEDRGQRAARFKIDLVGQAKADIWSSETGAR